MPDFEYFTVPLLCEERQGSDFSIYPKLEKAACERAAKEGFITQHRVKEDYDFIQRAYKYTFIFRRLKNDRPAPVE